MICRIGLRWLAVLSMIVRHGDGMRHLVVDQGFDPTLSRSYFLSGRGMEGREKPQTQSVTALCSQPVAVSFGAQTDELPSGLNKLDTATHLCKSTAVTAAA